MAGFSVYKRVGYPVYELTEYLVCEVVEYLVCEIKEYVGNGSDVGRVAEMSSVGLEWSIALYTSVGDTNTLITSFICIILPR